jgi:hypothetical protein
MAGVLISHLPLNEMGRLTTKNQVKNPKILQKPSNLINYSFCLFILYTL